MKQISYPVHWMLAPLADCLSASSTNQGKLVSTYALKPPKWQEPERAEEAANEITILQKEYSN